MVTLEGKPWFAVETKVSTEPIDPSFQYFGDRLDIPRKYQLVFDGPTLMPLREMHRAGTRSGPEGRDWSQGPGLENRNPRLPASPNSTAGPTKGIKAQGAIINLYDRSRGKDWIHVSGTVSKEKYGLFGNVIWTRAVLPDWQAESCFMAFSPERVDRGS